MRIQLTPELESALASAAQQQGTTPDLLAETYLRERLRIPGAGRIKPGAGSLADFLAGYIGVLGGEEENDLAEDAGRKSTDLH